MTELKNGTLIVSRQTGKVGVLMTDGEQHYLVNGAEHMMVLPQFIRAYNPDADRVKLCDAEIKEVQAMNRDMESPVYIGKNIGDAMKSRFKPYIVTAEADARISERWRIMARSAEHAKELFEEGNTGEFLEDETVGDEENREFVSVTLEDYEPLVSALRRSIDKRDFVAAKAAAADLNRAIVDDTLGEAAGGVATSYLELHDGLSDMIDGGRLSSDVVPDDFEWLSDSLHYLRAHPKLHNQNYGYATVDFSHNAMPMGQFVATYATEAVPADTIVYVVEAEQFTLTGTPTHGIRRKVFWNATPAAAYAKVCTLQIGDELVEARGDADLQSDWTIAKANDWETALMWLKDTVDIDGSFDVTLLEEGVE